MNARNLWVVTIVAAAGIWSQTAKGGFTYLSEDYYVKAYNDKGAAETVASSGILTFNERASVTWERTIDPAWLEDWPYLAMDTSTYGAGARQTSVLEDGTITVSGMAAEGGPFDALERHEQGAETYMQITFELAETERVFLNGELSCSADFGGSNFGMYLVGVELSGVFAETLNGASWYWGGDITLDETFVLEAGVYTLAVRASVDETYSGSPYMAGCGGGGHVSYSITLTTPQVPVPGAAALAGIGTTLARWLRRKRLV